MMTGTEKHLLDKSIRKILTKSSRTVTLSVNQLWALLVLSVNLPVLTFVSCVCPMSRPKVALPALGIMLTFACLKIEETGIVSLSTLGVLPALHFAGGFFPLIFFN